MRQRASSASGRRGFTLLLVLVVTVLVSVTVTGVLLRRTDSRRVQQFSSDAAIAHDVGLATEARVLRWLLQRGDQVVAPPGGGGLPWSCEVIGTARGTVRIQVDLYDRRAMLPPQADAVRTVLGLAPPPLRSGDDPEVWLLTLPKDRPLFPAPLAVKPVPWGVADAIALEPAPQGATIPAWTTLIDPWADGTLNLNTAPVAVLAARYRDLGLPAWDVVAANRTAGTWSPIPPRVIDDPSLRLVASSDRWAAMLSITIDTRMIRWWSIIDRGPAGFRVVRRYAADP